MFIYDFMSGMTEGLTGGETDEHYDPHAHRKIKKPCTYAETMTHMLKGSLGAGLLAMPNAVSRLGIILGAFGIMAIAAFATYCIHILVKAQYEVCKKWKRGYMAYPKSVQRAMLSGPHFLQRPSHFCAIIVDMFMVFWQLGICAIYLVFVAENIKQVVHFYGDDIEVRVLVCYSFPALIVLCMIKDLKRLSPLSTFSNACVILGLILVFFYLVEEDLEVDETKFHLQGLDEIPIFIGITLFALEAVGVVLALEYNMEKPKEFTGICGLFVVGMTMICCIYTALGVFGFIKYGHACKGSITLNLPENEKKAQVAKLTFSAALFLSYPLQNFVAWQIMWRKLRKKVNKRKSVDYALRVVVATIPFCMAVIAPDLGAFMGLVGALCLSVVAVIFPALMDLGIFYPNRYGFCNYKVYVDVFIVIFGIFSCCSGVYTSILEIHEAM